MAVRTSVEAGAIQSVNELRLVAFRPKPTKRSGGDNPAIFYCAPHSQASHWSYQTTVCPVAERDDLNAGRAWSFVGARPCPSSSHPSSRVRFMDFGKRLGSYGAKLRTVRVSPTIFETWEELSGKSRNKEKQHAHPTQGRVTTADRDFPLIDPAFAWWFMCLTTTRI